MALSPWSDKRLPDLDCRIQYLQKVDFRTQVTAYVAVEFIVGVARSSLLCRRQVWYIIIVVFIMTCLYFRSHLKL